MELSLLDESKRLLQSDLENICLENIQTCILIANLCASHGNPSSEALYFRIGNSMAQIMRLNSPTSTGSIVEREIERRVWWSLFMADRWCSSGIGLPRQIKDLGGNIDLPMDESVFHSLPRHLTRHEGTWKPGLWAHMISLVQHFGPIQDLNRQSAQGCFDGWELDRTAAELSQKLDLWEKMLPTDAKETETNFRFHQEKGTGGPFVALHLGYHHYSTLLYFRYLEARNSLTELGETCVSRCKHHASAYSALLRTARETEGCEAVYPTVGHMAVVSSSVLLHTLLFGDENELANARRDLNSNFAALMELKQYWANTASMILRLVTFQNVCLLSAEYTHRLDGWMVRFLIEHSLPLADKTLQTVPSGIDMNTDSLSIRAQELQQQGRYTNFELSGPTAWPLSPQRTSLDPHSFVRQDLRKIMRTDDSLRGIGIRVHRYGEGSASFTPDFEKRIVTENNIVRTKLINNETTPLQVGNGNFAFGVDTTGMQTYLPFNTMSVWAWHNDTEPEGAPIDAYTGVPKLTHGRNVSYDIPDPNLPDVSQWLIGNPNRINLGRIGLRYKDATLAAEQISNTHQELDLWSGVITSTFTVDGTKVKVVTQADFDSDAVTFEIESKLIDSGKLKVEFDFPYPPIHTTKYKYEVFVGVYDFPANHTTKQVRGSKKDTAHIYHDLGTKYYVNLRWPSKAPLELKRLESEDSTAITAHRYILSPDDGSTISFTAHFSPEKRVPDLPSTIRKRNSAEWHEYWKRGGFIDLTASTNPNATELQRRIVTSQYHVRVNSAATGESPQESGLMNNGWYGKFHMEMVVWHNAHWVSWGRDKFFHNIFPALYEKLLPTSFARAEGMGWEGARWPKMTETITGRSSPGGINAYLLWQQPHPMYMAMLAYKSQPTRKTLKRWDPILEASADYMASYAWYNESSGKYDLGPPSIGVTENTPAAATLNLAYEVAYWRYGLDVAREWKKKLGLPVPKHWTTVAKNLAKPTQIDGLYAVYDGLNASWWQDPALNRDPRSLIMLQGILPDTPAVDQKVARRTADKVWEVWTDQNIRGWGRPILAINSARIGNPKRAIYHLTAYDYWKFDDAGFAIRGGDGGTPPPFMPGNAGFLLAVAYMAEGWDGSKGDAPGFPKDDGWVVKHEGLRKAL
ncbi:hypothetical protein CEP53_000283 [Fusarium sp. AF-6]|nr:hypothetical protein CEP53_000283 [Fusarium sp. AF-6]